jgi:hypothetical protein
MIAQKVNDKKLKDLLFIYKLTIKKPIHICSACKILKIVNIHKIHYLSY